jgi:catechol-2,3-dioxygenase
MRLVMLSAVLVCFALGPLTGPAAAQTFPYDHIHVNVPDPAAAANWYEKYFGGRGSRKLRTG